MSLYPKAAEQPYQTGVACPYCDAGPADRCVTSSGNPYAERCHSKRRDAARKASIDLVWHRPGSEAQAAQSQNPQTRASGALRMTLWFVDQAGGIERARALLDIAAGALGQAAETE